MIDIRQAMTDPALFGPVFGGESFSAWRALLAAFDGLELDATELDTFKALTGRTETPQGAFLELWLAIGRRGGKSHAAAFLAVYLAAFQDYRAKLAPGEVATVMVIAADRKQARAVMRYTSGLVNENPMLRRMVERENSEQIELNNRCVIEITTASHRSVRGYTLAACICDEIAFWHIEGSSPDREIIAAIRPALATLGGRLIALSSPYAKRGVLWDTFKRAYGDDSESRVLVAQAPSRTMNPLLPRRVVDDAMKDDSARACAEYLAMFRSDIASFVDPQVIEAATRPKPLELPAQIGTRYVAFVDPSGGGRDEFSMAIAHAEKDGAVIDLVTGRRGSPAETVAEFVPILKRYNITRVTGDKYAGRWPRDEFAKHGIQYQVAELDRSGLYIELLAAMNSGRVEIPPCQTTLRQLAGLERRTGRAKDIIDHPPGSHDDRANAIAGVTVLTGAKVAQPRVRSLDSPVGSRGPRSDHWREAGEWAVSF
ncbi:hypothetical protein [Roseinatronobacter bogoriensis]|uniref:hypothetical protein n=1 Tax=Roseinatronobacter bogoriensis TaxID=119542 RepID=UPI0008F923EF|nr:MULTISPECIES: hypothetical protein [Rhodobaca]MBB4206427.1 hypothetical protein [Rhodobaca bogoriensis DSM 18756]TDW41171.1 hypothetical protein LY39_00272 [Rhodobaca barguzinensis]TDY74651.1 hypothetical protein EV660_101692 [Rhodobaca bogoriensis DSM 18756]